MGRYTGKKCRLLTMIGLTTGFFVMELVVGYVTNSMALVADSFHMLSDVVSIIIAFLSVKVSCLSRAFIKTYSQSNLLFTDVAKEVVKKHIWVGSG